ncbi:AMMECR1 domain-containing protein [Caldivirga sp. UBA161]|uniref:AMMECR1 domain-containing protein n=1 Tax=Caldivirga sp. UBA161 TaxID=1915569 RepID=UPI0025C1DD86|nr:AMMECR1 domain-containing protein [Caldivirga sp. UBA161]
MDLFRPLTLSDGALLIKLARYAIESKLRNIEKIPITADHLKSMSLGVWVSVEKIKVSNGFRYRELRGDVGSPYPIRNLYDDVIMIARYAAFNSPKYSPLSLSEVKRVVIEVVVNNQPRQVNMDNLTKVFIPGYHGLLIKRPDGSIEAYLAHKIIETAAKFSEEKNRLPSMDELISLICSKGCGEVRIFETQVFYELEPEGEVIERLLYMNKYLREINSAKGLVN